MKILLDTNVILDLLLDRSPFNSAAEWLFSQIERGRFEGYIGGTTVTTIFYLISKSLNKEAAIEHIEKLLQLFAVAPVNRLVLHSALLLNFTDFEDAVLHEAAIHAGVEAIITRDPKGFSRAKIHTYMPDEFIKIIEKN